MVLTPSRMIELETQAPRFSLPDTVSGKTLSLEDIKSSTATVIMFICNHCPFVKHIKPKLADIAKHYSKQDIAFIAISSNDVNDYPDDAPDKMKQVATQFNFCFPYLYDETQAVAKAYDATCTPDFFIFDGNLKCVYRGRFDESTPGNDKPVTGHDLTTALEHILAGKPVSVEQHPSMGCNIKWKQTI